MFVFLYSGIPVGTREFPRWLQCVKAETMHLRACKEEFNACCQRVRKKSPFPDLEKEVSAGIYPVLEVLRSQESLGVSFRCGSLKIAVLKPSQEVRQFSCRA